jgi:negative regulator of flagellin synthesis FlgM
MMKIGQPLDNAILINTGVQMPSTKPEREAVATANANAAKSTLSAGMAITVSTAARSLSAAGRTDTSYVDMDKVNAVRAAIQQGTYKINADAIAGKLLSNAQELLTRNRV